MDENKISIELGEIYVRHGKITPDLVIEYAKDNPDSGLYSRLEWDPEKALYEFQLNQARKLIRVYPVKINESTTERLVHVELDNRTGAGEYHPMSVVVKNPAWFELAKLACIRSISSLEKSLSELLDAAEKSRPEFSSKTKGIINKIAQANSELMNMV